MIHTTAINPNTLTGRDNWLRVTRASGNDTMSQASKRQVKSADLLARTEVPPASLPVRRSPDSESNRQIPRSPLPLTPEMPCLAGCLTLPSQFFSLAAREPRTKGEEVRWGLPTIFAGGRFSSQWKIGAHTAFFFNQSRAFSRVADTNGWGPIFPFSVGDCKKKKKQTNQ